MYLISSSSDYYSCNQEQVVFCVGYDRILVVVVMSSSCCCCCRRRRRFIVVDQPLCVVLFGSKKTKQKYLDRERRGKKELNSSV